ncbi:hypothetical protein FQA39_LY00922 [Lamprigera yunnana]|nr:hypothetical protein FQA39_LY00922 [Lamprigera yunnana]
MITGGVPYFDGNTDDQDCLLDVLRQIRKEDDILCIVTDEDIEMLPLNETTNPYVLVVALLVLSREFSIFLLASSRPVISFVPPLVFSSSSNESFSGVEVRILECCLGRLFDLVTLVFFFGFGRKSSTLQLREEDADFEVEGIAVLLFSEEHIAGNFLQVLGYI